MSTDTNTVAGFKGFDKDLKCREFQYELNKEFEMPGPVKACQSGFHFCEHPLNVFDYYAPATSRFAAVTGSGSIDKENTDTKVACSKIHVGIELSFEALTKAAVKFVFDRVKYEEGSQATGDQGAASATGTRGAASATGTRGAASATGTRGAASATGDQGAASATGDQGAASATGTRGAASATGDQGAASATGYQGAAVSLGIGAKAMACLGGFITVAEWAQDNTYTWQRINVKSAKIDGKKLKAETYYKLVDGKFTEVK